MNSVANGKIMRKSPFKRVYVQSAAGDAGGAIGAAIQVWHQTRGGSSDGSLSPSIPSVLEGDSLAGRRVMDHAYLGPKTNSDEISAPSAVMARVRSISDSSVSSSQVSR